MNLKLPVFATSFGMLALCLSQPALAFYNSAQGRWLNRDPVGENGTVNQYCFVRNSSQNRFDLFGLLPSPLPVLEYGNAFLWRGQCGAFSWAVQLRLNADGPAADAALGGIIVQNVTATFSVTDCAGTPIDILALSKPPSTFPRLDPADWPFYEGWTIPPGARRPVVPARFRDKNDIWSMPEFPTCTKGTIVISGSADYYDGAELPADFLPNPVGPGGELPTARGFVPPFTPPTSGPLIRTLTATWNCCPVRRDTGVVTKQGP